MPRITPPDERIREPVVLAILLERRVRGVGNRGEGEGGSLGEEEGEGVLFDFSELAGSDLLGLLLGSRS